jgi:mannose-1-phosphate guanylyltransferase
MDKEVKKHLYILIFSGGGGTRLWPLSRQERPKQFLKLNGDKTLIRQTFRRVKGIVPVERIFVVTIPEYIDEVREFLPEVPCDQILVEPARRNTAMAAGLGVVAIAKKDEKAIVANVWSDHVIGNDKAYKETLLAGALVASDGKNLVTTGLPPKYPHTGLGYVKKDGVFNMIKDIGIYKVDKFTEKPKLAQAKKMVASGSYLWHVGLFVWRVDTFMKSLAKHSPDTYRRLLAISEALGKKYAKTRIYREYKNAPDLSIDYALAEKARNFLVVEGKFEWLDLGDFKSLWQVGKKDSNENYAHLLDKGEWLGLDTKDSIVVVEGERLVATVGVTDLVVVATERAVLVLPKSKAQRAKEVVKKLRKMDKKKYL